MPLGKSEGNQVRNMYLLTRMIRIVIFGCPSGMLVLIIQLYFDIFVVCISSINWANWVFSNFGISNMT